MVVEKLLAQIRHDLDQSKEISLDTADARLLLARIEYLELLSAALLRAAHTPLPRKIDLPYRAAAITA